MQAKEAQWEQEMQDKDAQLEQEMQAKTEHLMAFNFNHLLPAAFEHIAAQLRHLSRHETQRLFGELQLQIPVQAVDVGSKRRQAIAFAPTKKVKV